LHHRQWMIVGRMHRNKPYLAQCYRHSLTPNGKNTGASPEAVDEQVSGSLGGGYDIRRTSRNTKLNKMISDGYRWTGRIVGDEADLDTALMEFRNALSGPGDSHWTQIDNAIKIEQHRIVGIDDGRGGVHPRLPCGASGND
jgi:hypothetical protein